MGLGAVRWIVGEVESLVGGKILIALGVRMEWGLCSSLVIMIL
jgi:hypothetical protein